jgi:hypothetical protein
MRTESIAEYLEGRISTDTVHFLGLTETWHGRSERDVKKEFICHHPPINKQYMIYTDRLENDRLGKSRGNGTMVLMHRSLRPFVKQVLRIPGKGIAIKLGQHKKETIVISVFYNEHHMRKTEELAILKQLKDFCSDSEIKIVGGDFNGTICPTVDRRSQSCSDNFNDKPETRILKSLTNAYAIDSLLDVWRMTHPDKREFTYSDHKTQSRIDIILANKNAMNYIECVEIKPSACIDPLLRHQIVSMNTKLPLKTYEARLQKSPRNNLDKGEEQEIEEFVQSLLSDETIKQGRAATA